MELKELRDEIRKTDEEMAELFVRRMKAVADVAEYKKEHGLAIEDADQEARVISERSPLVKDEVLREYYVQFLKDTMAVSKRWQHRLMFGQKIAFCSAKDDTGAAAVECIFPDASAVDYPSYAEAYEAVVKGDCDAAVLPFEVSYQGEVAKVVDLMFEGDLYVNESLDYKSGDETTRYFVLSRANNKVSVKDSQSAFMIMFTVHDETGGLAKAINIISAYNFNMHIMRSRPMNDLPWHYYFYAEIVGDDASDNGKRMLHALKVVCPSVKVVGSYRI